jgi:hypothetical protein
MARASARIFSTLGFVSPRRHRHAVGIATPVALAISFMDTPDALIFSEMLMVKRYTAII